MTMDVRSESRGIRLLLSGGGHRAMLGGVGVMLHLMATGEWDDVREVVSVSGGSAPNAALLTLAGHDASDAERLRVFHDRLLADRARPWATVRRVALAVCLAALVVGVAVGVLAAGGLLPGTGGGRPWLALAAGVVAVPLLLQAGRRLASAYLRDALEVTTGARGRELREFVGRPRQHVFCASGLSSGSPYYFWVGGTSFLGGSWNWEGATAGRRWGSRISSDCRDVRGQPYTLGDAVFASSSLPLFGGVLSPAPGPTDDDPFPTTPEPLIDGGVSGVFGQQISAPSVWVPRRQARRLSELSPTPPRVIAVDAFRHLRAPAAGPASRLAGVVRDRLSAIALLIGWISVSSEALYVNDLEDVQGVTLVRLCAEDLPALAPSVDTPSWETAWADLVARRSKAHAIRATSSATRSVGERLDDLRARVARLGLLNLTPRRATEAVTTGVVASYVARSRHVDDAELGAVLDRAGVLLFGTDERATSLRRCWERTAAA